MQGKYMTFANVRTRIAPSPTGEDIHIGNLYTALINFAVAKKYKGSFIVRIEDTDRERYKEGAEEKILSSLKAYGLEYDEGPDKGGPFGPYRQSERLNLYQQYAKELVQKGAAYYCFCSKERLEELRREQIKKKEMPRYDKYCLYHVKDAQSRIEAGESYVIRLNVQSGRTISFQDVIRGEIKIESEQIDDQILLKSDGFPTYHLGVVVDDHLMKISHVIRAEEWISSTPKHILLYEAFGWEMPIFAHLPILRNPDRSKLSKRKNPVWASWYLEQGYLPEAVLNFLALMGWSHPEGKEIFTLNEFIQTFELKDVKSVGPIFDIVKLTWMNQQYIQNMSDEELIQRLKKFLSKSNISDALLRKLLPLTKTRMETLRDFDKLTSHFFVEPNVKARSDKEKVIAEDLKAALTNVDLWIAENILFSLKEILKKHQIRMPIIYYMFTGEEKGLPLPESLEILGKEKTILRLERFIR